MPTVATPSHPLTTKQITLNTAQIEILDGILTGTIRAAYKLNDPDIAQQVEEIQAEVRNSE